MGRGEALFVKEARFEEEVVGFKEEPADTAFVEVEIARSLAGGSFKITIFDGFVVVIIPLWVEEKVVADAAWVEDEDSEIVARECCSKTVLSDDSSNTIWSISAKAAVRRL